MSERGQGNDAGTPDLAAPDIVALVNALMADQLQPWLLPWPLNDLYWVAFWAGQGSMRARIRAADAEAERAWSLVHDERQRLVKSVLAGDAFKARRLESSKAA